MRKLPLLGEAAPGFNGATPLRVWKEHDDSHSRLPWVSFNGATPLRVWKDRDRNRSCGRSRCRFNGATPLRVWKVPLLRLLRR